MWHKLLYSVCRPFADFFVALLGNYRKYVKQDRDSSKLGLDSTAFIASHPKGQQPFLRAVIASQAFQQFIQERVVHLASGTVISG